MTRPLDSGHGDGPVQRWSRALTACFARRLRPEEVDDALAECHKTYQITGRQLADLVLTCGGQPEGECDPLLPRFFSHFLQVDYLQPADLLDALLQISPYRTQTASDGLDTPDLVISPAVQDAAFALLPGLYASGDHPRSSAEAAKTFRALLSWIQAYNAYEAVLQMDTGGINTPDSSMATAYEFLGTFLVIFLNNVTARKNLAASLPKGAKPKIISIISHFASTLSQWSQSTIPQQLQFALKIPPFIDQGVDGQPNFSPEEIAAEVQDVSRSVSRSGLYIYLNAALCGRPRVNDVHLMSFLQVRYPDDQQSMVSDLIVAAFDALANALQRQETAHLVTCHRSFIANKVPLLLSTLSLRYLFPPGIMEQYIQMAIGRIETHPFPPLSSDSAVINESIRDARQDFIRVCQLHRLVSEATVSAALGQTPSKSGQTEPYHKHHLVQQIISNPQKAEDLIGELDRMNGNVGSISAALADALKQAALGKETMTIKVLCMALCRKLPFLDIMLQHIHLADLLKPLGTYLNEWTEDEDQSELQPAYEDFATIFLFTLAIIHRYDIQTNELSDFNSESFIIKVLVERSRSRHVKDLSEEEKRVLSNWTKGLFAVDEKGESNGIRDETMSGCSPQTFFLLVPTLFEQIVLACRMKALAPNTLKGGLEFLLEPFLLPSLVGGMSWLVNHVWVTHKDTDIVLQILHKLIKPSSISGDADMMHQTILGIMYKELRPSLQDIDKRMPSRKDVSALQAALKQYADSQYEREGTVSEVKEWTGNFANLEQSVSNVVMQLSNWSTQSELSPVPPNYTHRMIDAAVSRCGTEEILDCLVSEVSSQTAIDLGSSGLEAVTSLICSPQLWQNSASSQSIDGGHPGGSSQYTLSDALKLKLTDAKYLLTQEQSKTETLVRLGRLVDRYAVQDIPMLGALDIPTGDLMEGMDAVNASAVEAVMSGADPTALNSVAADMAATQALMDQGIDLSGAGADLNMGDASGLNIDLSDHLFGGAGDTTFDLGLDAALTDAQGNQQQTADDDIFAGIDLGIIGDDDFY